MILLPEVDILTRLVAIIEQARTTVVRTVNSEMVLAYWHIGREIVEEQQQGRERATYGEKLLEFLSEKMTKQLGKGFSVTNLRYFRQFYLSSPNRTSIHHTAGDEFKNLIPIRHTAGDQLQSIDYEPILNAIRTAPFSEDLSWSHYRVLMKVENELIRSFYEIEAIRCNWSKVELERQIATQLFERISKDKTPSEVVALALTGEQVQKPSDAIRDPLFFEFLNIPEPTTLVETDLEQALINHLQSFLLELGQGFAFIGRQQRLTLDGDHFYADLVFYHTRLKCYVIVDLKTNKLTHADLGQMQLYVNYYDREIRDESDNPTLGLVLCTDKNEKMVEYLLSKENEQIFASRYKLFLPAEQELETELIREMKLLTGGNDSADKEGK